MNPEKSTVPQGPPKRPLTVLLVSGMYRDIRCWENFLKERDPIERELTQSPNREFRFVPVILKGHEPGNGRQRLWLPTLGDYVEDVKKELRKLRQQEEPFVLVGHSMGALVAAAAAQEFRPAGLVLLAPLSTRSFREVNCRLLCHHPRDLIASFVQFNPKRVIRDWRICQELFFSEQMPEETVEEHRANLQAESLVATLQMLTGLSVRCRGYRPLNGTPVLILGAADDQCVCPYCVKWVANKLGVSAKFLPNLAHDMMLDPEWKVVLQKLYEWLDGLP